ncbi:hypothetical protein [Nonomuraea sp. NPDC049695]|uniref:hypothetical protein n=1 Tax=Nonomuraea sp. NPDC049695 TaxID=3154734 RepID=UPI0034224F80
MSRPTAIDPPDCGCTECIIGEYKPLAYADDGQIAALIRGELRNNTGLTFTIHVTYELEPGQSLPAAMPTEVTARAGDRTWTFDPYLLGFRAERRS